MRKEFINNPRYPHQIRIVRISPTQPNNVSTPISGNEDPFAVVDENQTQCQCGKDITLYEGEGRSFTDTTTNGMGQVDVNKRKASIPVRYDKWAKGRVPLDGDTIFAVVGNNTEVGRVRDCEPDNDRTIVYWEFVRV